MPKSNTLTLGRLYTTENDRSCCRTELHRVNTATLLLFEAPFHSRKRKNKYCNLSRRRFFRVRNRAYILIRVPCSVSNIEKCVRRARPPLYSNALSTEKKNGIHFYAAYTLQIEYFISYTSTMYYCHVPCIIRTYLLIPRLLTINKINSWNIETEDSAQEYL